MNTLNTTCKNCGSNVEANYCSHCGQSTKIERINIPYLFHNLIYSFFHVDKGIFYTAKALTLHSGQTIRDYLAGKRAAMFKPFSYLFILAAIYVFLQLILDTTFDFSISYAEEFPEANALGKTFGDWINKNAGIAQLILFIPVTAFLSFRLFRKSGYNYGENLIINTYANAHSILCAIILLPFMYLLNQFGYSGLVFYILLPIMVQTIVLCSVFNTYSVPSRIIKAILWLVLQYFIIISFLSIIIVVHLLWTGVDFSKY